MHPSRVLTLFLFAVAIAFSGGCSGGSGNNSPTHLYAVSGIVDGLTATELSTVELRDNDSGFIQFSGDGAFASEAVLADGAEYAISVAKDPRGHVCTIERGVGRIAGRDVTDVAVHCPSTSDATLAALSISTATLIPAFSPATVAYTATATIPTLFSSGATMTTVTATATEAHAMITIAGATVISGLPSAPVPLKLGPNPIDITVTGAGSKLQTHYVIVVNTAADQRLEPSVMNGQSSAFGNSVAISGDTLVVGAPEEEGGMPGETTLFQAGAVYVFTRAGTTWSEQAHLTNPGPGAWFGRSVAIEGDTLVVGAPLDAYTGAVYVFGRTALTWSQDAYLTASNAREGAAFGISVALSGDTLAVGSNAETSDATGVNQDQTDTSALSAGAAYVFIRNGTAWSQEAYIKASNTRPTERFGGSIALSGDTLAVGASGEKSDATGVNGDQGAPQGGLGGNNFGAVYVFTRTAAVWTQQAYVKSSNASSSYFGTALALSGETLVVGAPEESSNATGINADQTDSSASDAGAAYVFVRTGTAWSQQAYVKASNTRSTGVTAAYFGTSVALLEDALVVGAPSETSSATGVNGDQGSTSSRSGAVYVFSRTGLTWSQRAYVKASQNVPDAHFGSSVALSSDALVAGASGEPTDGSAYVF